MKILSIKHILGLTASSSIFTKGQEIFSNPVEYSANENGVLKLDMTIEYATIDVNDRTIQTRLLNGLFPGPTLRISAGGYMEVNYFNNLQQQETSVEAHNFFQTPDKSNLHFHGPFISGSLPSDDVTMGVEPQNGYDYKTTFPEEHLPGTHWIHPHYHGSTTLQVAGGASAVLIVDDPVGYLPAQVENARELIFLINHFNVATSATIATECGDTWWSSSRANGNFLTNSGKYRVFILKYGILGIDSIFG